MFNNLPFKCPTQSLHFGAIYFNGSQLAYVSLKPFLDQQTNFLD